jgi:hypothetical protein
MRARKQIAYNNNVARQDNPQNSRPNERRRNLGERQTIVRTSARRWHGRSQLGQRSGDEPVAYRRRDPIWARSARCPAFSCVLLRFSCSSRPRPGGTELGIIGGVSHVQFVDDARRSAIVDCYDLLIPRVSRAGQGEIPFPGQIWEKEGSRTMLPPIAIQVFPLVIPRPQMFIRWKLRSSSWRWPEALIR